MLTSLFDKVALSFFPVSVLDLFRDEMQYGFNNYTEKDIKRIGYCVNLTRNTILKADKLHIDLILTHHNIWDEYFELKDDCLKLLKEKNIIHFFSHLPLDAAPFGPSRILLRDLGLTQREEFCRQERLSYGVIGEYEEPVTIQELENKLKTVLGHNIKVWKNNDRLIKRVGIVAGSGGDLETLHEAHELNCDAYITGEKKLKTILYCGHVKMNFLLGSHTFTETGGIKAYAHLIQSKAEGIELIQIPEEFIE